MNYIYTTYRELEGDEYNNMRMLLALAEPIETSDNQSVWCETYLMGGKIYRVFGHSGLENPIIEVEIAKYSIDDFGNLHHESERHY